MHKFTSSLWSILLTILFSTISYSAFADDYVPITKMTIQRMSTTVYVGSEADIELKVEPYDATCKDFKWELSDSTVLKLECWKPTDYVVTGLKPGTCTVTVTSVEENPVSTSIEITVEEYVEPSVDPYIEITKLPDTLIVGDNVKFYADLYPADLDLDIDCTLSDPTVLELTSWENAIGWITALKAGTCTLTVTYNKDTSVTCSKTVIVEDAPFHVEGEDSTQVHEFVYPVEKNFVDIDFAGKSVTTEWTDNDKVTALLKEYVTNIPEGASFKGYRTNKDLKGYTHYDYQQMDAATGCKVDGCELLAHVDATGNLVCLTGILGTSMTDTPYGLMYKLNPKKTVDLDLTTSTYTQKSELSGKLYYYSKGDKETSTFAGASDGNGTYVLQDPGRVYTLDYSNAGSKGFKNSSIINSLPEALNYAEDFTSKTADFSENYQGLSSKVNNIKIYNTNIFSVDDGTPLTLEIRKANVADITDTAEPREAWDKGTFVTKSQAETEAAMVSFDIDNLIFDVPNREQDPDGKVEDEMYFLAVYSATDTIICADLPIEHDCYTTQYQMMFTSAYIEINRELINKQPALNVHWGLERTLDVYKEKFGLNSFDNQGSPVIALVNTGEPANDSFDHISRDGCGVMKFGLGSFERFSQNYSMFNSIGFYAPLALEAMAHEFTHIVTNKLAPFEREASALSESYADIMGMMVRRMVLDNTYSFTTKGETISYENWNINQIAGPGSPMFVMRRFDDPSIDNQPKYYKGETWIGEGAYYDCHFDCSVQNHWFYLLCTGAKEYQPEQGEPVTITAIPRDSAELITFASLMYFTTKYTDYPTARKNSIHAAEMYFGANSQEVQSVLAAWYAVGVGTDEWQPGMPATVDAVYDNSSLNTSARKLLKNGRIVIQKDGKEYNAIGQEL